MSDTPRGPRVGIKGPLMFSAFFGVVAFLVVLFAASGGTDRGLRYDLAFAAFGIAFIVCLVFAAMLSMSYKENAEHLGRGDGVNLRSADRLKRGGAERPKPGAEDPESETEAPEATDAEADEARRDDKADGAA
ncbi:hypothetical protein GCM10027449_00070 [Sinomonas notoginsengisoli]|uniref:hypothetical protein n=1 Tax=Sinomonas notoginsengisoli TaxID=1457311 RepID=UPI001F1DBDF3|nr:hypothetical protein [Sinomonas notoginsengisoli]